MKKSEIERVEQIEEIVKKAQLKSAKAEGVIESIEKEWEKKYGTSDIEEIKKIQKNLQKEIIECEEKESELLDKLENICDWDELEKELDDD